MVKKNLHPHLRTYVVTHFEVPRSKPSYVVTTTLREDANLGINAITPMVYMSSSSLNLWILRELVLLMLKYLEHILASLGFRLVPGEFFCLDRTPTCFSVQHSCEVFHSCEFAVIANRSMSFLLFIRFQKINCISPFDQRCIGLHDPRVAGSPENRAWLPHAETMINKVTEDGANVDKFYHERLASAYNSCPLYGFVPLVQQGPGTDIQDDANWHEFFAFVCNFWRLERMHELLSKGPQKEQASRGGVLSHLSEANTLEIVLKMRERKMGASYTYSPTHLLHGELCMVLQTKKFQLQSILDRNNLQTTTLKEVTEFGEETIPDHSSAEFFTHEIAFGPVGDPTVRPTSVFFDIPPGELVKCTPQQAKHHKRSRHRLKSAKRSQQKAEEANVTHIPPFSHFQPRDEATFNLITRILEIRLRTVQLLSGCLDSNAANAERKYLDNELESVKDVYFSLLLFWVTWSWPEQVLEEPIDNNTDVPPVDSEYNCHVHEVEYSRTDHHCYGLGSQRYHVQMTPTSRLLPSLLWKSYLINIQLVTGVPLETVSIIIYSQLNMFSHK